MYNENIATTKLTLRRIFVLITIVVVLVTISPQFHSLDSIENRKNVDKAETNLSSITDNRCAAIKNGVIEELNTENATKTLVSIYCYRTDLQKELPQDSDESGERLVAWACSVASNTIKEENSTALEPYRDKYCESAIPIVELQIEGYEELSSMMKMKAKGGTNEINKADQLIEEARGMLSKHQVYQAQLKLDEVLDILNKEPMNQD